MISYQAKDLYVAQTELVQMKVNMAVNSAIDRVVEQITLLRSDMNKEISGLRNDMNKEISGLRNDMNKEISGLRNEMHLGFSSLDKRVVAIETRLGIIEEKRKKIYDRALDYLFKAGYGALTLTLCYLSYSIIQHHTFLN